MGLDALFAGLVFQRFALGVISRKRQTESAGDLNKTECDSAAVTNIISRVAQHCKTTVESYRETWTVRLYSDMD